MARLRTTGTSTPQALNPFKLSLGVLFWMPYFSVAAAAQPPVITEDPKHPGYYKPFRCLSVDRNVRGHWGAIRNSCGFDVEAHWQSAKGSGSSWTLPAGGLYPLFEETDTDVLGCLRNDHLNPSLRLCRGANLKLPSEADKLAKELGVQPRPSGNPTSNKSESAALAKELGITAPSSSRADYTAAQLQSDLKTWEEREQRKRLEEERQRSIREEQERLAAVERAKRAEVIRQQRAIEQRETEAEEERQAASRSESTSTWGTVGSLLGGAALGVYAARNGINPATLMPPETGRRSSSAESGDESCRSDPQLISQVQNILESCETPNSICGTARAQAACYRRVELAAGSCASVAQQARDMQRQYNEQAAAVCR